MDIVEKRKYPRYSVKEMDIGGRIHFTNPVTIHDISIGGACITSSKKLNLNREYILEIKHDSHAIRLRADVIWVKMSGSHKTRTGDLEPIYTSGLKFKDILSDPGAKIVEFLGNISRGTTLRLLGIRLKFSGDEKGTVSHPEQYFIKRIGKGGLLIEVEHCLDVEGRLPMEIFFPGDIEPVTFTGRIASCQPSIESPQGWYEIGVEFLDLADDQRSRVESFIDALETSR